LIYLLITNRREWAEFAYKQYLKTIGCKLIVLDNTEFGIDFWKNKADCQHYHIPECDNISKMFNWFADQYQGNDDLFYMDDDIEIATETLPTMIENFKYGYDCVKLCNVYVTHGDKSGFWNRKAKHIGSVFISKFELWQNARFNPDQLEGVCYYFMDLNNYNCRFIQKRLANYHIHDKNVVLKESHFKFTLPKIELI